MRGGMTSHAAVVARGMGTCCVSGCSDIVIDKKKKYLHLEEKNSTRVIIFLLTEQQARFIRATLRQ